MALLWAKQSADCCYEVRSAGHSVRLYSNGVFHSQWNPNRVFSDAVWDLLGLAAFPVATAVAGKHPLRVLVLGVGGGAVIRQLLSLLDVRLIQGIDLDPTHLAISRRWFGLSGFPQVKLVVADAVDWVANYKGPAFDLVIDDLFGHSDNEVSRSVVFDRLWAARLAALVADGGALVINNGNGREFKVARSETAGYPLRVQLTHPRYDNRMLAVFSASGDSTIAGLTGNRWRRCWQQCMQHQFDSAAVVTAQRRLAMSYLNRAKRV